MEVNIHCILLVLIISAVQTNGNVFRVVGGHEAPVNFGRSHASLQNLTGYHVCGGAVISKQHVITAAHCMVGAAPEYIKIVVGTTNLDICGINYDVASIIIHEEYNASERTNDVAIVKANNNFDIQSVDVLPLYQKPLLEGDKVVLTGFGSLQANGDSSRVMHKLDLSVFSQETCKFAMRYSREVCDTMFCTFTQIGEGTCHGDSGGPLMKDNELAGLVSWGIPCAIGFPDVHTRISPYLSWIHEALQK